MAIMNAAVLPCLSRPIQTLSVIDDSGPWPVTTIIRRWRATQARACRLCPKEGCTAQFAHDGQAVCIVKVAGEFDAESAAIFRRPDA
jgi:hypothetical protein